MSDQTFHIVQLRLSNVQGLIATSVNFPAGTTEVVIGGKNGSGKSSTLNGIEWLLTGLSGSGEFVRQPKASELKDGEKPDALTATGSMIIKGQNGQTYTITREKSGDKARVSIKSSDGGSHPAEFLKGLLGPGGFINLDPFALANMQPAKRMEAFKKAYGLDFAALDKEDEELKDLAKELDAKATGIRGFFQDQPKYPDLPAEELSSKAILDEIELINAHNNGKVKLEADLRAVLSQQENSERVLLDNLESQNQLEDQIAELKKRLNERIEQESILRNELKEQTVQVENAKAVLDAFQVKDTSALAAQLATIEETNQKIRDTKTRDKYRDEHDELEAQRVAANLKREEIKAKKREMIAAVKFPVEGLEFGDGDIVFRKPGQEPIPFDSLSSAEKLRVGTAFGLASSGPLKVVLTEDADRYDDDSRALVREMVKDAGGMIFLEMVRPSGGDFTLIIEEGKVKDAIQNQEALL